MEITVGIDVSKKRLDVYVHPAGMVLSLGNDEAGLASLVVQLSGLRPDCIGMEATGGYEKLAAASLAEGRPQRKRLYPLPPSVGRFAPLEDVSAQAQYS